MRDFIIRMNTDVKARVVLCILCALPIPLSLLSWVASLLSLSGVLGSWASIGDFLNKGSMLAFMVLAGTYGITYLVMVIAVSVRKKIGWIGLLPIFHIALCGFFFLLNLLVNLLS